MGAGPHGTLASLPDRELVLAFQAGEDTAFDHLYERHRPRVAAICHRMLGNRNDAEEATQETFLKAFEALGRFNGRFHVGSWLARIATNVCVDHLRSRGRAHLVTLPANGDELRIEEGPESLIAGRDPRIRKAIRELQPTHARALVMRTLEGLSHREIGERMAMGPSQVKALLYRARRSLRRAWDRAQGWAAAPVLAIRAAISRGSEHAHRAGAQLAVQTGEAAPVIGGKLAVAVVAASLSGLPATEPYQYEAPPARLARPAHEMPMKEKGQAARPQERSTQARAGEAGSRRSEGRAQDRLSMANEDEPGAAPARIEAQSEDSSAARGAHDQLAPVGTGDAPTVVDDAHGSVETLADF
jgi:RNA polymerase sigma-70 factor (ECF subfamily)